MGKKKEQLSLEEMLVQALVKEEDRPYEVPENWVWTRLGDIGEVVTGNTPSKNNADNYGVFLPFFKPTDLNQGFFVSEATEYLSQEGVKKARVIPDGSTLVTCIGATIGKCGYTRVDGSTNQQINSIIPYKKISNKYVYFLLSSPFMQDNIISNSSSTTLPILNKSRFESLNLPLPPLPEQQRIVALIESLFEKLDRAKELVQNALDSFENRKSAILHRAFTGELTAKWREENGAENISGVIADLYNQRLNSSKTPTEKSKIEAINKYEENNTNESLPEGWRFVSLDKLCKSFQYGTSNKSDEHGEVAVIRMGNLQSGKIDWTDLVYSSDKQDIEKYILKKGDVLFNRTNSPELVGKTSIYEGEKPAIFAGYLIRINNYDCLDSHYLNYALNTSYAKEYCISVKSDGVNQSNINAQKLAKFEIPFCSLAEQQEIVRILDSLLEKEQRAKELCGLLENIDHMKKSILARAFRGELGTNNPEEESALELLRELLEERIL